MTMRRLFAVVLALCLFASVLIGCSNEEPANTTGAVQTGKEEETIYLLTTVESKNDQGEVVERHTYTYDDRGLVLTKDVDFNRVEVWNDELGIFEFQILPCDGVVDHQTEFAYDKCGNPTKFFDANYEYTYDSEGKITAFAEIYSAQTLDYTMEYNTSKSVKIFQSQRGVETKPELRYEIEYDEAGRITQMTRYEPGAMSYQYEYDAEGRLISRERITEDAILFESSHFIYDKAGRVVKEAKDAGGNYYLSYQYENDMLVAINDEHLATMKQDNGVLTVQYGDFVLTYTPMALGEQEADMARNRWNQAFGRFFTVHSYAGYPLYAHHPMYDLDTVLLLPKEIF